ncbi:MAG: hypothetical protein J0M12_07655 [Deltaproteobacteria bacterium]|nr:hypothetical protein [Deltaproteobacteria bacterium]
MLRLRAVAIFYNCFAVLKMKAAEKIIDALTQLMEGYAELQESLEHDYGVDPEASDEDNEANAELDTALLTEVRAAVESIIENEDYTAEEVGAVISALTDALQEIDPDIFTEETEEEDEDDDDLDDDDDDDDLDDLDEDDDDDDE